MTIFNVSTAAALNSALTQVQDGDRIRLAPGKYDTLRLADRDFSTDVTITSQDLNNPATLSKLSLVRVSGVTVEHGDVYEGRCYVRYQGLAQEATVDAAGAQVVVSRVVVRVPHGPVFRVGDVVAITASPDTPHLAGAVYRVASIDDQSQATAQRLLCEDLQAGVTL